MSRGIWRASMDAIQESLWGDVCFVNRRYCVFCSENTHQNDSDNRNFVRITTQEVCRAFRSLVAARSLSSSV